MKPLRGLPYSRIAIPIIDGTAPRLIIFPDNHAMIDGTAPRFDYLPGNHRYD